MDGPRGGRPRVPRGKDGRRPAATSIPMVSTRTLSARRRSRRGRAAARWCRNRRTAGRRPRAAPRWAATASPWPGRCWSAAPADRTAAPAPSRRRRPCRAAARSCTCSGRRGGPGRGGPNPAPRGRRSHRRASQHAQPGPDRSGVAVGGGYGVHSGGVKEADPGQVHGDIAGQHQAQRRAARWPAEASNRCRPRRPGPPLPRSPSS